MINPPEFVMYDGQDCARAARDLQNAVRFYIAHGVQPPRRLVEHADDASRVARQFLSRVEAAHVAAGSATPEPIDPPESASSDPETLSVAEAAARSNLSRPYITQLARGGILAGSHSGPRGSWRLDRFSFEAWQASREAKGDADG